MRWDELKEAMDDARSTVSKADSVVGGMAALIVGRLRNSNVGGSVLTALKKELAEWNIHTGKWKRK